MFIWSSGSSNTSFSSSFARWVTRVYLLIEIAYAHLKFRNCGICLLEPYFILLALHLNCFTDESQSREEIMLRASSSALVKTTA